MTVKTANFRGDIYKNDKIAELRCGPAPIEPLPASEMVVLLLRLRTSKLDAYVFAALSFDY